VDVEPEQPSTKGPAEWFTGDVWIDSVMTPQGSSQVNVGVVHFAPGARSAWHSHAGGQTLYVTEGRGRVQSRGDAVVELRAGDVHRTVDGDVHWHGAADDHLMTHLTITQGPATWGDHVTDAEYQGE
jgi:quercetin dioxygenase-like cupin family protein